MLGDLARKKLLIAKSFKIFISLMWYYYQPQIFKKIFVPYVCYMTIFVFMASQGAGAFLDDVYLSSADVGDTRAQMIVLTSLCAIFWCVSAIIEGK